MGTALLPRVLASMMMWNEEHKMRPPKGSCVGVVHARIVPSPRFNNKPRITALINFLPEVDRGSIMEVGLDWILAMVLCPGLVAKGLLYFVFIVATCGQVALIALVVSSDCRGLLQGCD
jgi:hypothetical protein